MAKQTAILRNDNGTKEVTVHTSAKWSLTALDWAKAAIMAGISAAGGTILAVVQQNGLHLNSESLNTIGGAVLVGTVSYLIKQFGTDTKVVEVKEP